MCRLWHWVEPSGRHVFNGLKLDGSKYSGLRVSGSKDLKIQG